MQFTTIIAALGLAAAATACTPGNYACGNQNGAPGPDGAIYSCNALGDWVFSSQCGGGGCCTQSSLSSAYCKC